MEEIPKPSDDGQFAKDKLIDLLDGAEGEIETLSEAIKHQRKIAADSTRDLEERLETYEDIFESEVGDTSLSRARNIEREFGMRQLYLKFEGGNPTGTQKDRIAFTQAMDALRRGFDTITMATCGNYGVAMSLAASLAGLRCMVFIPEEFRTKRVKEMTDLGADIKRVPGDYESAVYFSREHAEKHEIYDAIKKCIGLPAFDVLKFGAAELVEVIKSYLK
jgi:threonine synthase